MGRTNLILAAAAAVLLAASVATYRASVARAERFERGQKLIAALELDQVAAITIGGEGEEVNLRRQGDRFTVAEVHDYPADNQAVNRLLRDALAIALEKELGSGSGLEEEAGIEPPAVAATDLTLADAAGKVMVGLRIGKPGPEGQGHYVQVRRPRPGPVYLTSARVDLDATPASYLEKEIVDVEEAEVRRIEGADFVAERATEGGALELVDPPSGREPDTGSLNRLAAVLRELTFENVHLADDPLVKDLDFQPALRVVVVDGSGYQLATAELEGKTYARVSGFHTVERVEFGYETPEEELAEKADVLSRADEIQRFNDEHASWVYELAGSSAGRVNLRRADLIAQAG